ncbi:MAG TPA: heavy metal-binding domain-containing protein [Solirubrobacteraceae bacterium]|nr:heavy metal-binding domain-containing protein [Solirubrobacteraceae bacterium]
MSGEAPQETAAEAAAEAEAERSQERIEAGGIPIAAERRLQELARSRAAGGTSATFTSDLSVNGFALCHRLGLRPISQVMGSSVYQVGYQGGSWPTLLGSGIAELRVLSQAWNEVRRLALGRLSLEAHHAGADAVVGVQLRTATHDWAEGAIEYAVLGTAVKREGRGAAKAKGRRDDAPVLTELTVADYAKLLDAGVEPLGIVAWTSVFFATYEANWMLEPGLFGSPTRNYELPEFTQGVYSARERVMQRIGQQALEHGASGIVGMRIGHTVHRRDVGGPGVRSMSGLVITFDAIGTAVHDSPDAHARAPQTKLDLNDESDDQEPIGEPR